MDGSAAELDVIDVTGRRIVAREVGSLGAGSHRVEIADRLASGVYLLRLRQGAHTRTLKAVVLN
jgi:hypothetical protein